MTQLDSYLSNIEKYGFNRAHFPMQYGGHNIILLSNDAYIDGERLKFDFTFYCNTCGLADNISGRFPDSCDRQTAYVATAKLALFSKFDSLECQP